MLNVVKYFLVGSGIGAWSFVVYLSMSSAIIRYRRAVAPKASALAE